MKMVIGHIIAFLSMTAIAALMAAGVLIFVVALGSFVFWQFPVAALEWGVIMLSLRICIGIGSVSGFFFLFSKEGQEVAKDWAELFEKKKATKIRVTEVNINE